MTLQPATLASRTLYESVGDLLTGLDSNFYNRVFARFHPFSTNPDEQDFPYVVMVIVGGGDANIRKKKDAEFQLQVVCYSDDPEESEAGALVIDNALDDNERKDPTERLTADQWVFTSVTAGRMVTNVETYEQSRTVFADGKVYRVTMEVIN